ncbi:MAG TPA: UrcA family protein [Phenylobacterium sp.]
MIAKTLFAALAATTAMAAGAAQAEVLPSGYEQNSATVRIGDLNLNSDAGAQKALSRIASAAGRVCGDAGNNMDLGHRRQYRACVGATVQHTVAELDSSRVNGVYANTGSITLAAYRGN